MFPSTMLIDNSNSQSEIHSMLEIKLFKDERLLFEWEKSCQNREMVILLDVLQDLKQSVNTFLSDLIASERDAIHSKRNSELFCETEDFEDDEDALWQMMRTIRREQAIRSSRSSIPSGISEERAKRFKK